MREEGAESREEAPVLHAMSIDDAYRVERVLARGVDGVTECVTIDGAGPFVRKRIPSDRARREVWAALAACHCPHVPRVRATYEMPDEFVVVHDFAPGETLERTVAARALSLEEAVSTVLDLCAAVEELHAHGVIHRDLSPANVVLSADGAHVIDFGLARKGTEGASAEEAFGTWGFAAPEQYGFAKTDERSDVYSLGRLLGFALAGVRPDDERYEGLLQDGQTVPACVRAVIERACDFEPSARYQSAAEFAQALKVAQAGSDSAELGVNVGEVPSPEAARDGSLGAGSGNGAAPAHPPRSHAPLSANGGPAPSGAPASSARRKRALAIGSVIVVVALAIGGWAAWSVFEGVLGIVDSGVTFAPAANGGNAEPSTGSVEGAGTGSVDVGSADAAAASDADAALELAECGWSVDASGLVIYAIGVANPSSEWDIQYPELRIVGRDGSGTVVFSDTQVLSRVRAGETVYFSSVAGNGTVPTAVDFEVTVPSYLNRAAHRGNVDFSVSDLVERTDGLGSTVYAGEVSLASGSVQPEETMVAVSIVLRDEAGQIVSGAIAFVDMPAPGESVPFEALAFNQVEHASYEAHACVW